MDVKEIQYLLCALAVVLVMHSSTRAERSKRLVRSIPTFPCTSQGVEWVRSPTSCSKYVVCGFGQPVATMLCPNFLYWSVKSKNCVPQGSRFDDCSGSSKDTRHSEITGGSVKTATDWTSKNEGRVTGWDSNTKGVTGWDSNTKGVTGWDSNTKGVTGWDGNSNDDKSRPVTDWNTNNNDGRSKAVTIGNSNRNDGRSRLGTHWQKNGNSNRDKVRRNGENKGAVDWKYDKEEKRDSQTRQWNINNRDYTSLRDYPSYSASTYPHVASTPAPAEYTTSSLPRWRWAPWDFTMPSYDDYPSNYDDDYSTDSDEYPLKTEKTYPEYTEEYPAQSEKYPESVENYPTMYPAYDDYEDFSTDSHGYPRATVRWLRTSPARTSIERTTTVKSPFARFHTTRRRPVIANDGENDYRRNNYVQPKYYPKDQTKENENNKDDGKNVDDWLKKLPWWQTWGPVSTSQPETTTSRPWWAPDDVLPWLTPSSVWVPETQSATTTAPTTTPLPTTTPPTTTTVTSPPVTTSATTSTAWYTVPDSTVTELPVSPTIISWSPPEQDFYDYDEDADDDNDVKWTEEMTAGQTRSTPSSRQTTQTDPVLKDYTEWPLHNSTAVYHPECGVAVTNMIVGGLPASEGRWPWVTSLRLTWARRHVCGGTLVHPQWIVTAAHCVFGSQFEEATDWRAVFGNVQPTLTSDVKKQLKIDLIVRHPEFVNGGNYPNDIAMMRLEKAVDVTGFRIRHACLPSRDKPFLSNSECWIMGWGETKGFEEQSVLQELVVKIRRNQACAARWGWKRILNSHVCVGNGDGGACNGDSGGPLVCLRDGYYYLVGVTSWGVSGCQTTGYPSVFSRVSFYQKWIDGVIQTYSTFHFPLKK